MQDVQQLPSISVVIPCFNEQQRLEQTWEGIRLFLAMWPSDTEFIIVDDGSTDNTVDIITNNNFFCKLQEDGRAQLIKQTNSGKGGAIANGIPHCKMQYVLTVDADMSTMPTELLRWLKYTPQMYVQNNTVFIASRVHEASTLELISSRRRSGNLFNFFVRLISGLTLRDTQCGFKLYPTKIAQEVFSTLKTKGWAHDIEILLKLTKNGVHIVEMPIHWNEKDASKISLVRDGLKMLLDLILIRLRSQ